MLLLLCPPAAAQTPPPDAGPPPPAVTPAASPAPPDAGTTRIRPEDVEAMVRDKLMPADKLPQAEMPATTTVDGVPTDMLGAPLPEIPPFKVADLLVDPAPFVGQFVVVRGLVRRNCRTGCWLEVAEVPSDDTYLRIIPGPGIRLFASTRPRRITAYGKLVRHRLSKAQTRAIEKQAMDIRSDRKPGRRGARTEWQLEAEGVMVQWLE